MVEYSDLLKNDIYGAKLFKQIEKYDKNKQVNHVLIQKAFSLAKKYHAGQNRKSGEPYYSHPVAVAAILTEYDCSTDILCAALLHDTVEDTSITITKIAFLFGKDIAKIIDFVTNLDTTEHLRLSSSVNFYKIQKNRKAIILKLCDRIHNTSTMQHLGADKMKIKIDENFKILIPIAKNLQLHDIATRLENLSIKLLNE